MSETAKRKGVFNIFILDDSSSTRNIAKYSLEQNLPCSVELFADLPALLSQIPRNTPDLILLEDNAESDVGISACESLKKAPVSQSIPVFFLSAKKDPSKRVAALKAGGVDFLLKPFYPEELVTRVRIHIQMHRLRLENAAQIAEQKALLRVLCHDLVNPIFAAHSLLDLKLSLGKPVEEPTLKSVLNCCQSALDIVTHVREEHSLVKTNKQFKSETVLVAEAFEEARSTLGERLSKKSLTLTLEAPEDLQLEVKRVVLVHNILNNLLTNAIKFSHEGSKIEVRARKDDSEEFCVIEVRDYGIGMPPQILKNVFKDAAKTSRKGTGDEAGTGFGMPLVKRYVEKSGGAISIASVEAGEDIAPSDQGTTVKLTFPL
ncbi:response regulator [Pelagicoccus sp. NFK12]|uniref:histidine kinase n=1 Tax=Pelagicoccus enzymogenes TaxID=2773457 RepID=A0A927IGD6_9BACT|nr:ATP-binding protein [Pelagicoccus enzymogenes]MBD5778275.1 response regulator [Pelagicoccus enzymogenes]MDQ8200943.1 ATP-binding protein [Pelagicoccus enzymogenes]